MEYTIPDYSQEFGRYHVSASGGTQPVDEHVLKMYLRKEHQMNFPMSSRPRAGQIVQDICDRYLGLDDYSPVMGQKDGIDLDESIRKGCLEYAAFTPLDWDGGNDAEAKEEFIEHLGDMARFAVEGIKEFFDGEEIEGEYQRYFQDPRIDVPITMFLDYASETKELDLKCSLPRRNPPKKDGTRSWSVPKPAEKPNENQVMQQAVYWKGTGLKPGLLFVTAKGYHIATAENCEALTEPALELAYENVVRRWLTVQNLMKASGGSWKRLFSMVAPDMSQIATRHGPDVLYMAKEMWRVE